MTLSLRAGGASAMVAACILALFSATPAAAQLATAAATRAAAPTAIPSIDFSLAAVSTASLATPVAAVATSPTTPGVAILSPSATPGPVSGVTSPPPGAVAVRPAVTHASLWPMIWANLNGAALDEELSCVATAVYFEARGEPFDGQLAVADVVLNRARSGRYPASYCGVVKQPAQFSFVRGGRFPRIDLQSAAWGYAQAIARIAQAQQVQALPADVLWYHADYVAPGWGHRLSMVEKIGAHIFYRS